MELQSCSSEFHRTPNCKQLQANFPREAEGQNSDSTECIQCNMDGMLECPSQLETMEGYMERQVKGDVGIEATTLRKQREKIKGGAAT